MLDKASITQSRCRLTRYTMDWSLLQSSFFFSQEDAYYRNSHGRQGDAIDLGFPDAMRTA